MVVFLNNFYENFARHQDLYKVAWIAPYYE